MTRKDKKQRTYTRADIERALGKKGLGAPEALIQGNVSSVSWSQVASKVYWFAAVSPNTTWSDEILANMFRTLTVFSTSNDVKPNNPISIENFLKAVLSTRASLPPLLIGTINSLTRDFITARGKRGNVRHHLIEMRLVSIVASTPQCLKYWADQELYTLGRAGNVTAFLNILKTKRMPEENLVRVVANNNANDMVLRAVIDNYEWAKIPLLQKALWSTENPVAIVAVARATPAEDMVPLFRTLQFFDNAARLQKAFIEGVDEPRREALKKLLPELLQNQERSLRITATKLLNFEPSIRTKTSARIQ